MQRVALRDTTAAGLFPGGMAQDILTVIESLRGRNLNSRLFRLGAPRQPAIRDVYVGFGVPKWKTMHAFRGRCHRIIPMLRNISFQKYPAGTRGFQAEVTL